MNTVRTPLFYMANLGSEFSRILLEHKKKDFGKMHNSILRAKNIIEKIEAFPEMKERARELEILKLIIDDLNLKQKKLEINNKHLINYFTPFVMRFIILKDTHPCALDKKQLLYYK